MATEWYLASAHMVGVEGSAPFPHTVSPSIDAAATAAAGVHIAYHQQQLLQAQRNDSAMVMPTPTNASGATALQGFMHGNTNATTTVSHGTATTPQLHDDAAAAAVAQYETPSGQSTARVSAQSNASDRSQQRNIPPTLTNSSDATIVPDGNTNATTTVSQLHDDDDAAAAVAQYEVPPAPPSSARASAQSNASDRRNIASTWT